MECRDAGGRASPISEYVVSIFNFRFSAHDEENYLVPNERETRNKITDGEKKIRNLLPFTFFCTHTIYNIDKCQSNTQLRSHHNMSSHSLTHSLSGDKVCGI